LKWRSSISYNNILESSSLPTGSVKSIGSTIIHYIRNDQEMDYYEARSWCEQQGGSLPIPTSPEENQFLRTLGNTFLGFEREDRVRLTWSNWREGMV